MISPNFPSASIINKIKTDSIVNPLLWASVPILSLFGYCFLYTSGWKSILSIIICVLWILNIAGWYGYFALRDPNRLHSEEHQREIRRMDIEVSKSGEQKFINPTIDQELRTPLLQKSSKKETLDDIAVESE